MLTTKMKIRLRSPDGGYVEGDVEQWVVAIYYQLSQQQQKAVCDHMYKLKIEQDG